MPQQGMLIFELLLVFQARRKKEIEQGSGRQRHAKSKENICDAQISRLLRQRKEKNGQAGNDADKNAADVNCKRRVGACYDLLLVIYVVAFEGPGHFSLSKI